MEIRAGTSLALSVFVLKLPKRPSYSLTHKSHIKTYIKSDTDEILRKMQTQTGFKKKKVHTKSTRYSTQWWLISAFYRAYPRWNIQHPSVMNIDVPGCVHVRGHLIFLFITQPPYALACYSAVRGEQLSTRTACFMPTCHWKLCTLQRLRQQWRWPRWWEGNVWLKIAPNFTNVL